MVYNYQVILGVSWLALSYYVVKFYEWNAYFGRNQMPSYHAAPVIGKRVAGIAEKLYVIATTLGETSLAQDDVSHLSFDTAIKNHRLFPASK